MTMMRSARGIRARARHFGFALPATLFVLAFAGSIAAAILSTTTITVGATRNRVERERAFWRATGCEHRIRAAIDLRLKEATTETARRQTWATLGAAILGDATEGCSVVIEAAGTRVDANNAPASMLANAIRTTLPGLDADALARALVAQRELHALVDLREALFEAGVSLRDEALDSLDTVLSTVTGRVSLATAPARVLAALPGFTAEAADVLVARREASGPLTDLAELLPHLSQSAADRLIAEYPDALRLSTPVPDAWYVRATAASGAPSIRVELQCRLARIDDATDVVRAVWLP